MSGLLAFRGFTDRFIAAFAAVVCGRPYADEGCVFSAEGNQGTAYLIGGGFPAPSGQNTADFCSSDKTEIYKTAPNPALCVKRQDHGSFAGTHFMQITGITV